MSPSLSILRPGAELTIDPRLKCLPTSLAGKNSRASLPIDLDIHRVLMITEETGEVRRERRILFVDEWCQWRPMLAPGGFAN